MRIELDDDATGRAEKMAGGLGMSVNGFVNWLVMSTAEANIVEAVSIKVQPAEPMHEAKPKMIRYRKSWVARF